MSVNSVNGNSNSVAGQYTSASVPRPDRQELSSKTAKASDATTLSTTTDTVTISAKAYELASSGSVSPLSAGGTTLPPIKN